MIEEIIHKIIKITEVHMRCTYLNRSAIFYLFWTLH